MKLGVLFLLAVPAMIACDSTTGTGEFTGTPAIRIAGTWTYTFNVTDDDSLTTCQAAATALINQTQNGDQFTGLVSGVWTCTRAGESYDLPAIVPISAGELAGQAVRFIAFGCVHLGAVTGAPPNHFTGTLNCTFPITEMGPTRPFSGTWEAVRQ